MTQFLILCFCNNTVLEVFRKLKLIENYELNKKSWMPDWCDLCFFFWCSLIEYQYINIEEILCLLTVMTVLVNALGSTFVSLILNKIYYRI